MRYIGFRARCQDQLKSSARLRRRGAKKWEGRLSRWLIESFVTGRENQNYQRPGTGSCPSSFLLATLRTRLEILCTFGARAFQLDLTCWRTILRLGTRCSAQNWSRASPLVRRTRGTIPCNARVSLDTSRAARTFPRTASRTRVPPARTRAARAFRRLRLAGGGVRLFRQLFHGLEELRRLPGK